MRKLGLLIVIAVFLAGVSVQAQKKAPWISPPTPEAMMIQDDEGSGVLMLDLFSGEFTCNLCEYGYKFSGRGQVRIDGCSVSFSALDSNYRIFASIEMCDHHAKVLCQVIDDRRGGIVPSWLNEYLVDSDMLNNTGECGK